MLFKCGQIAFGILWAKIDNSFRHTVATRLVRNPNVDPVTAAVFLGHSCLDDLPSKSHRPLQSAEC